MGGGEQSCQRFPHIEESVYFLILEKAFFSGTVIESLYVFECQQITICSRDTQLWRLALPNTREQLFATVSEQG